MSIAWYWPDWNPNSEGSWPCCNHCDHDFGYVHNEPCQACDPDRKGDEE